MERAFHLMVKGIHARAYFFLVKDVPLLPHDHSLLNNLAIICDLFEYER